MTTRITGLGSGLDIDSLVKTTMKAYTAKVDVQKQKKEVLEIKQKLYRDIINDGKTFFNKYLDIAKSDNILNSKNYATTAFDSTNATIATATSTSESIKDNYTVHVDAVAKAASTKLSDVQLASDLQIKNSAGKSVLIKNSDFAGKTDKEKAAIINSRISSLGLVASTSDFSTGINIKTAEVGVAQNFSISTGSITDAYFTPDSTYADKSNQTFTVDDLIGGTAKDIEYQLGTSKVVIKASDLASATATINTQITTLEGEAASLSGAELDAKNAEIETAKVSRSNTLASTINTKLSSIGLTATKSETTSDIVIKPKIGTDLFAYSTGQAFDAAIAGGSEINYANGANSKGTVTNSAGTVYFGYDPADIPPDGISSSATSNKVILDGVQFNLSAIGDTTITGKTDTKAAKDKLVNFINDYNKMIEKINKLTTDKHDRSYTPLTADQKEAMSESEIKLWNEKVEKGQLRGDNDLNRIVNNLKNSMSSSVSGASTILEKIGITPVKDYTSKNGMFTVDEDKLTAALESNPDAVMEIFTKQPADTTGLTDTDKYNQSGIAVRMKNILNNEFMFSTRSSLINKAGIEGTTSFIQNTLSKSIKEYEEKISDMEDLFSDKEQALYTKYSKLETAMSKYNSQSTYLSSMMGTGN